ncbi:secretin N-terminal domain-containing protein [Novipirellula artificiosorum]|uniref:Type II secretion system protein D n=1 Tax=Novipirellula artificiosorum TaxID=2528016 RepID=A0A5C6DH25_9BACT|nr:secretin N-terminal domain-containing protein [Novipirellula artificiosorum]TWU35948.1 Type II secretion system protein D precursor [Novipirellula artificiosorum]
MHQVRQSFIYVFALTGCLVSFSAAVAQSENANAVVSYALRHKSVREAEAVFAPLVADSPDVHIQADEQHGRLVLTGPPWAHDLLKQVLDRIDRNLDDGSAAAESTIRLQPPQSTGPQTQTPTTPRDVPVRLPKPNSPSGMRRSQQALPSAQTDAPQKTERTRRLMPLPMGQSKAIRDDVLRLFGERLQMATGVTAWTMDTPSGPLQIGFDLEREDVLIDGPVGTVDQFTQLLKALAERYQRQQTAGTQQRVLMLKREVQPKVRQMMQSSRSPSSTSTAVDAEGASLREERARMLFKLTGIQQSVGQVAEDLYAPEPLPAPTGQPAGQPDEEGPREQDADAAQPSQNAASSQPQLAPSLPQLEGVEVETLPDLDAIILRGRDQDLDQLSEIIRELEQLSRETQPAIELIRLRHASSVRVAELIEQTQEDLLGTRQGRATVTPLAKPNALLLLGWGEAVTALKELTLKLDRPLAPEMQFNIFRLKYASATSLQQTIASFFAGREGELAPTIQSTVDVRTNSLIVDAAPRDMVAVARLVERLDTLEGGAVQRTRVFPIQNSMAADVAETLRETIQGAQSATRSTGMELMLDDLDRERTIVSGVLENVQITVDARKNSLIVSAPAENFDIIEALIQRLDSPGMVAKIKIFPIQNGDAASLIQTLRSLLPSQPGADPVTSAQLSSAPGESSLAPLRFTVDVRSNSIIATGSDGDLKIVDALLLRLDEADAMQRQNTVYQLKNSPAVDVALAINEFLRNTRQVENASPGTLNPYAQLEKEVVVVPEPVSNKLIVSATPRYFDEVRRMIEKLDEQPPQVMIQVLIAEVLLNESDEFGVELGIQDSVLFDRSLLGDLLTVTSTSQLTQAGGAVSSVTQDTVISASNEPGFNFNSTDPLGNSGSANALSNASNVGGQGLSNFALGRSNAELGFGGLVLSASSQNVSVLLRALEESRRLEVLSRPQVLTLDNQPAFIQVGQRVPRITGSTINQIGQQNTVTLENVGLILGVTPRISPEGNVTMEIDAEKSEVGPESEGIPVSISADGTVVRSPRVNVASAQATVSAADGETIILGGLISTNRKQHHRKVPWLGDLPLIKHLFRYDSVSSRRAELLIILTPHVVRSPSDMERLKQTEMARMSWCACDVFDLHGEIISDCNSGSLFDASCEDYEVEVIYPHDDPRGLAPRNMDSQATGYGSGVVHPPLVPPADPAVHPNADAEWAQPQNRPDPMWPAVEPSLQPLSSTGPAMPDASVEQGGF